MSIQSPNYTQVPNEILDEWIGRLSKVEFKIIMMICRKTFGWQKEKDKISLSQFIGTTGAGRPGVVAAIKQLEDYDLIEAIREDNKTTEYSIKVVPKQNQCGSNLELASGSNSEPTKEIVKKTKQNKKNPIPPSSLDEVLAYIELEQLDVDGREWFKHFEAGDWYNSHGEPVLRWKQTLRSYHRGGWMPKKVDVIDVINAQCRLLGLKEVVK